ncbi:MAG TPA: TonB-dependent receptor [Bacteroidales bacterium]|nr:TonB-dependent receptor [Bacteroidales bacterium]
MYRIVIISTFLFIICFGGKAQNLSSKLITLKADSATLGSILTRLSDEFAVQLFYSPSKIPVNKKVSVHVSEVTLPAILEVICSQAQIGYKLEKNQVILSPSGKIKPEGIFTISGFVSDSITGERLIGANIIIHNLTAGTVTNAFGFYSFTLAEGSYKLRCSFIGYQAIETTIDVSGNQKMSFKLKPEAISLKEISLHVKLNNRVNSTRPGQEELPLALMRKSAALLGEIDIVQYLKMLPGVQPFTDGPYGLYVRGSTPQQTSFVLDDAPMFNMYHISGWFSTINPDVIKDVQIYKSHLPAKLGGSISSIVDIRLRDGNNQRFVVTGGIGTITSRLTVEGPISKGKASFLVSARRSYIDKLARLFLKNEDTDLKNIYFYDLNTKLNYSLDLSNKLYLSFYKGRDILDDKEGTIWGNTLLSFRWNRIFSNRLFSNLTATFSNYKHAMSGSNNDKPYFLSTTMRSYSLKYDFTYYARSNNKINFGLSSTYQEMTPIKGERSNTLQLNVLDSAVVAKRFIHGIYSEADIQLASRFNVNLGLRISAINNTAPGKSSILLYPEPMATLRYNILENLSAKAGYSHNSQYHHGARMYDIFIPFERYIFANETLKPQYAAHFSTGLFFNPGQKSIEISVESYMSRMQNQYRLIPNDELLLGQGYEESAISGKTNAYGIECSIRKTTGRFTGIINYTWSRVTTTETNVNNGKQYNPYYDRRHNLTINAALELSKRINISASWIYMSGNPFSLPLAKYQIDERTFPFFDNNNMYNKRMPDYHRLDVGVNFILGNSKHFKHSLSLMLYNAYAKRNPIFYYYRDLINGDPDKPLAGTKYSDRRFNMLEYYIFQFVPSFTYEFKFE